MELRGNVSGSASRISVAQHEAALARHGGSITRHDLAIGLQWEFGRVERALRALDSRLAGTGLCLRRSGWDSYRLTARSRPLGSEEAERLRLAHGGRVPLPAWAAALLSLITSGHTRQGLDEDDAPEPYRGAGIDALFNWGLITRTGRGYRPSDEVIYSLDLNPWQY